MSTLKIALAAGSLAIALSGCSKPAADNSVVANTEASEATPANEAMMPTNEGATDNSGVAENATNAVDEDKASSGGVVLKQ